MNNKELMLECLKLGVQIAQKSVHDPAKEVANAAKVFYDTVNALDSVEQPVTCGSTDPLVIKAESLGLVADTSTVSFKRKPGRPRADK